MKNINECIALAKLFDGDMVIGKNRDRNYNPNLKIVRELTGYNVEICYMIDVDTDWSEGMNEFGIGLVNSALFVKRDEKEKKLKKSKKQSKDGVRIREALGKDNLKDVIKSLLTYHGGIKGHTLVGNGKQLVSIEHTSRTHPVVKVRNLEEGPIVRTNHGIDHKEAGYQNGNDKVSSDLRMKNALEILKSSKDYKKLFPKIYMHKQEKGPKYDLVRSQNKLWTSSQILMNLNQKYMCLYLIPEAVKFIGVENRLPKGHKPKISVKIKQYKQKPMEKYSDTISKKPI